RGRIEGTRGKRTAGSDSKDVGKSESSLRTGRLHGLSEELRGAQGAGRHLLRQGHGHGRGREAAPRAARASSRPEGFDEPGRGYFQTRHMKLVILDRDGTINYDSDQYIKSPAEWKPIPGSLEAIARLTQDDWHVVVATNQSGIERGLFDMATLNAIHAEM